MPAYDGHLFNPPAPLARVTLRSPGAVNIVSDVPMLIDSGADVTLIPHHSVAQLSVASEPNTTYEIMGFDGRKSMAEVARLELIFLRRTFRGRFLIGNRECGVIGRDILNHVSLILNGPSLIWQEAVATGK